jgi:ATP-binding cassette, subfamily B, bacterial PglK
MILELKKAIRLIDKDDAIKFYFLLFAYFITIILELFSLALVLPVVNIFFSDNIILNNTFLSQFLHLPLVQNSKYAILALFLITFLLKNITIIFITKKKINYLFYIQSKVSKKIYKSYITKPYSFFFKNSASSLSNIVVAQSQSVKAIIEVFIIFIVEGVLVLFMLIFLFSFNATITLSLITLFAIMYYVFFPYLKKVTAKLGTDRIFYGKQIMKIVNESFGGIKTVKIYKKENFFKNLFYKISDRTWEIENKNSFLLEVPRYVVEMALIVIFISVVVYFSANNYTNEYIITFCTLFLIALYRLMPSFNKILAAVHSFRFYVPTINIISNEMDNLRIYEKKMISEATVNDYKFPANAPKVEFKNHISLESINFKYQKSNEPVFKNMNFKIKKNKFIGIIGESGSGKTTLVDIISGLLKVDQGNISIDGFNIKNNLSILTNKIAYVPQDIFLIEDTIKSNIIFSELNDEKNYDKNKLQNAINNSNLLNFIDSLEEKLDTHLGENGIQLSGGQKQRIGIARALYRDSDVIIFDESTSALDRETEDKILYEINKLKKIKTIIYITHKENTLKYADEIYKIYNNDLVPK